MYKGLFVIFILLQSILFGYDIDKLIDSTPQKTVYDISNESKSINDNMDSNTKKLSKKQLNFISNLLYVEMDFSINGAHSWCSMIKNQDSRYGCFSGIELAKENILKAHSWCSMIKNQDSRYGCFAGIELAKGDILKATSWCSSLQDQNSRHGCYAGIELSKDNINKASSWCSSLRDQNSRHGCYAGIELAKEDISKAKSWCSSIKDEDSRYGCLSDVILLGHFIKENRELENNLNNEIQELEKNTEILSKEITEDELEVKELLNELEHCIECLDDPELKRLYLQLGGK